MKKLLIILTAITLSSCAILDKLRGGVSPHANYVVDVPVIDNVEDVRG